MPKRSYQLINPVIEGTFKDTYDANESIEAAESMWKNLSEHIISHVPKFMFTMRNISSGDLHHFEVAENREKGSYTINKLDMNIEKDNFNNFLKNVDEYGKNREYQTGGKRRRYDVDKSSSSSSSSDIYPDIKRTSPIAMFHYNNRLYYTNNGRAYQYESILNPQIVAVTSPIFTPVFKPVLGTFVGIWP
jgi:hypothetical protein